MPIIDAHCHIYPEKVAQKAVESIGAFYSLAMSEGGTCAQLVHAHDEAGITHAVVHSVATNPHQVASINTFISEKAKESGGRFTGLGTLHPDSGDMRGDVERLVALGLHGVKLHPDFQRFRLDDEKCMEMYGLCQDLGLPMLLHTGDKRFDYSNPNRLIPVLKKFPRLTVVGAHFGGWSLWVQAAEALNGYQNLSVDCSSSLYALSPETARRLISLYGAERMLFGTDYPMWSPKEELARFDALKLSDNDRALILYQNAAHIYHIAL